MHTERNSEWVARLENWQDESDGFAPYEEQVWISIREKLALHRKKKRDQYKKLAACLVLLMASAMLLRSFITNKHGDSLATVNGGIHHAFHGLNKMTTVSPKQIAVQPKKQLSIKNTNLPYRQIVPDSGDQQNIAVNNIQPINTVKKTDSLQIIVPSPAGSDRFVSINELGIDPQPVSYPVKFYKPKLFATKKKTFVPELTPEQTSSFIYLKNASIPVIILPSIKN